MAQYLLEKGMLRCIVPDTMKVGESSRVIVSIAKGLDFDFEYEFAKIYSGVYRENSIYNREQNRMNEIVIREHLSRNWTVDTIAISRYVRVDLFDPRTGFEITPLFQEKLRSIGNNDFATWEWELTPVESGRLLVIINVSTKIYDGYEEVFKEFKVFEKSVLIRSNPKESTLTFIEKFWQWIVGTLIIPLVLYLRRIWRERYIEKKPRGQIGFKSRSELDNKNNR